MTTTNLNLTGVWQAVSTTTALVQVQDHDGCLVHVGTALPTAASAYIQLQSWESYVYSPTADTLYLRTTNGSTAIIAIVK